MTVLATIREPFGFAPRVARLPEGMNLQAMRDQMRGLPDNFDQVGVICLNGHAVAKDLWPVVTPRVPAVTEVTFHVAPLGGGDDGGKSILAIVAAIALTAATGFVAGGGASKFLGAGFAKGTFGAAALAGGVSLAGSLLISALTSPPSLPDAQISSAADKGNASADGNVLSPGGSIPRVIGRRKVYPPLAVEPLTYFDGDDEVVEAVYALSGPHELTDIKVGETGISDLSGVAFETREGWPGDAAISLVTRQSRTEALQTELRGHTVGDDGITLESSDGDTDSALPQKTVLATRQDPDEFWLHLSWPQGVHKNASETDLIRIPIRLRIRAVGAVDWINLPEMHYQAANIRQKRATVKLIWTDDATTSIGVASSEGWVEARTGAPGQTAVPLQPDFVADGYFQGAGDDYVIASNVGTTGVDHIIMDRFEAAIYLDEAIFPKGRYEVEIERGVAVRTARYSSAAYTVGGTVWDLFGYQGSSSQTIAENRDGIADSTYVLRAVSLWNEHPIAAGNLSLIAVRARNRRLERVSTVAGGYVPDWDGVDWREWTVTDNPAPHLRNIFAGSLNAKPVPKSVLDDDELVIWRADCTAKGYRCNALIEGLTVDAAAEIVAACGYGKPRMSDLWGIVRDYDRSTEDPVQIFTPRNSNGFSWKKAFADLPDGFRVSFRDETRDFETHQVTVPETAFRGLVEGITYEGLIAEAEVEQRANHDLAQARLRNTFYSLEAPAEAIVCRRGSLVGVEHDMLTAQSGRGRVIDASFDGSGDITQLVLDDSVPVYNNEDVHLVADFQAVEDVQALGLLSSIALRRSTGAVTIHPISNATGETDTLTLTSPIDATGVVDDVLAVVGISQRVYRRMVVFGMEPRENLDCGLTLLDEAPELWT